MATIKIIGASTKEVIEGGTYRESGSTGLSDNGLVELTPTITDDINLAVAGAYTVTYTLAQNLSGGDDEVAVETTAARAVVVIAAVGTVDTTFDLGDASRSGAETSGTRYDTIVDDARSGINAGNESSAYFSELALDPYEVANSK